MAGFVIFPVNKFRGIHEFGHSTKKIPQAVRRGEMVELDRSARVQIGMGLGRFGRPDFLPMNYFAELRERFPKPGISGA
jgi:hypothetical protein